MLRLPPIEQLSQLSVGEDGVLMRSRPDGSSKPMSVDVSKKGYGTILFEGRRYKTHRLIYLLTRGVDPYPYEVDHIDGNPRNNAPANLRLATRSQNQRHQAGANKGNKTSGIRGVCWNAQLNYWQAQIKYGGKSRHLGIFKTKEEAAEVAAAARLKYFGQFAGSHLINSTSDSTAKD